MLLTFWLEENGKEYAEVIVRELPIKLRAKVEKHYTYGEAQSCYMLHRVWVARRLRDNGHATQLLKRTLQATDAMGARLFLRVKPFDARGLDEEQLRRFYRKYGFRSAGVLVGWGTDLMMREAGGIRRVTIRR